MSVPDPRKRSPFEAPVILTSAPRSSLFRQLTSKLASPRHAQFLSTGPSSCHPPETTDRNNTSFSPKSISRSPDPRSWIPPLSAFSLSHTLFSSHLPPLLLPLTRSPPPRVCSTKYSTVYHSGILYHRQSELGSQPRQLKTRLESPFHMFSTRFLTPPLATRFIFLRPTRVALANSLALVTT